MFVNVIQGRVICEEGTSVEKCLWCVSWTRELCEAQITVNAATPGQLLFSVLGNHTEQGVGVPLQPLQPLQPLHQLLHPGSRLDFLPQGAACGHPIMSSKKPTDMP